MTTHPRPFPEQLLPIVALVEAAASREGPGDAWATTGQVLAEVRRQQSRRVSRARVASVLEAATEAGLLERSAILVGVEGRPHRLPLYRRPAPAHARQRGGVVASPAAEPGRLPPIGVGYGEETTSGGTPLEERARMVHAALRELHRDGIAEVTFDQLMRALDWPETSTRRGLRRALERGWVVRRADGRRHLFATAKQAGTRS